MVKRRDQFLPPPPPPRLFVFSGLSGAGKDAVLFRMRREGFPLEFIVTVTTRQPRAEEKDGVHYRFVSREKFQEMVDGGELLEWAEVYGHSYGVPGEPVRRALAEGRDTIVKVDVQGAATIRRKMPEAVLIFLSPPSPEEHVARLTQRRTETPAELELRLQKARGELDRLPEFDYLVFNPEGKIERAVADVAAIIRAEKCRVNTGKSSPGR
ncbi:MAG: guanylate kinase [Chloroflexota bacterium]